MVAQVAQLTDENVYLKSKVVDKEKDLQFLQNEIDHFEELLNKSDDNLAGKDQTITLLQHQLKESRPLTAAVLAALGDNEITQARVCTECETSKAKLSKFMKIAKELQYVVDHNTLQIDFLETRVVDLDERLMAAEKEMDRRAKEVTNMERLYERVAEERNLYERRFHEVLQEQESLDAQIRKLSSDKSQLIDNYEDELFYMKNRIKEMSRARVIQKGYDETVQVGLKHLQCGLQKNLHFLGVFKRNARASKLDVVNKLLVHVDRALNTAH